LGPKSGIITSPSAGATQLADHCPSEVYNSDNFEDMKMINPFEGQSIVIDGQFKEATSTAMSWCNNGINNLELPIPDNVMSKGRQTFDHA
jgi:hypothetical protein